MYFATLLDVTGKRTVWSVQISPVVPLTYMSANARLVISTVFLIAVSSGSSSSMGFFDRIFFITWYICPFSGAKLLGIYFITICTVITGHDLKYTFWISLIHVDLNGLNDSTWSYFNQSILFVICYALLILCSISLTRCGFFSKGCILNTVALYLVPVKWLFPSFIMWTFFVWKWSCTLHHIFSDAYQWTMFYYC